MASLNPYLKAVYGALTGALVAFGSALSTALADHGASFASISDGQWITAVVAALVALPAVGGAVYGVTNKPKESTEPTDDFEEVEI